MALVVVVQHDRDEAARYAQWLDGLGHSFLFCEGPSPSDYGCALHRLGFCPLWELGDVLLYEPWLHKNRDEANSDALIAALRRRYPAKPLVILGPSPVVPSWAERLARNDSLVRTVFPASRAAVRAVVEPLLMTTQGQGTADELVRPSGVDECRTTFPLTEEHVARDCPERQERK